MNKYLGAFYIMVGRCQASRRAGDLSRASRQVLAASRIMQWAIAAFHRELCAQTPSATVSETLTRIAA